MERVECSPEGDFAPGKAIRIHSTNNQVNAHSEYILKLFQKKNTEMFLIKSQDQLIDTPKNNDNILVENVVLKDMNKTGQFESYS